MSGGLRGLTWDHPRGYVVLDALAAATRTAAGPAVRWDRQPLEGFESRPLRTLADDYDLVVLDHPGLGEAVRDGALRPLDEVLSAAELAACADVSAGSSYASYRFGGRQWALPIDAAAQVSVGRPDLLEMRPATWDDARRAAREHRTAVCLGGPHALLMFSAICVALGASPAAPPAGGVFADPEAGAEALAIMADLLAHADPELAGRNPIAVLDAMAADGGPAYCPLVYGYVTYARPRPGARALAAFDAPAGRGGTGSVLGGTGVAVTRSCADLAAARGLLLRLVSEDTQVGVYRELGGQSADRRAWQDAETDASAGGFYSATRHTIEQAWVRPRFPGYVEFQAAASAALRDGLRGGTPGREILRRVNQLYTRESEAATTRRSG
ncbi:MAG TPA: extracellular solute-binding protein [Trebonia sp.]|nr:extracellular solute-binding protein [Trebonia sp.]